MARAKQRGALALLIFVMSGCGVPALPLSLSDDQGSPDLDLTDMASSDAGLPICLPSSRVCQNNAVRVCSTSGRTFSLEQCPSQTFCQSGQCLPLTNTCSPGEFFTLSATQVLFDTRQDLKPEVAQITLLNCSKDSVVIQKASIDAALHGTGQAVFSFENGSPQGLELPAGVPLTMKVRFRPRRADALERGQLFLTVEAAGELIKRVVDLKTRTWCLGMTPRVEVGVIPEQATQQADATLYNCGSMPITISGAQVFSVKGDASVALTIPELERPLVLGPHQAKALSMSLEALSPGPINAQLRLEIPDSDASYLGAAGEPSLTFRGYAYNAQEPCLEELIVPMPLFNQPIAVPQGDEVRLSPMSVHPFAIPTADRAWRAFTELTEAPQGAPYAHIIHGEERSWFVPYKVGAYRLKTTLFNARHVPSCQPSELAAEVRPTTPVYVELVWAAPDDPVPEDVGVGRGPDLDLHVRYASDQNLKVAWGEVAHDCFALSSNIWLQSCLGGIATLFGANYTGALPEAISLNEIVPGRLDLGVLLMNTAFFESPSARLRVFWSGHPDVRFDALEARSLSGPYGFWFVGSLDLTSEQSLPLDFYLPSGFPGP